MLTWLMGLTAGSNRQGNIMPSRVEAEVRLQIDSRLRAKGWVLDPQAHERNVFVERGVLDRLSSIQQSRLGDKSPDYTLFTNGAPTAVLEAKKPDKTIEHAFEDGCDYADRIGVDYVFACNGPTFKTLHIPTGEPLHLNKIEILEPIPPSTLNKFSVNGTSRILTVSEHVIKSRDELIDIFKRLDKTLRNDGIRAGLDRFTEFANLLFLKLLSEQEEDTDLWNELIRTSENDLPDYLNNFVLNKLRGMYGSDVISETHTTGKALKEVIRELNPLRLSSVDEDIKGVAFEHFLRRTTSVQNDLGEYFTPRHVVRFMVKLLNPQFRKTVYDPFCGTGGFLTEAFRHLGAQVGSAHDAYEQLHHNSIYGMEITNNARIAKMNMILFGDGHSGVEQGSSLDPAREGQYDYVLSNIPFSLDLELDAVKAVDQIAKDDDEACLLKCFNSLRIGGEMAVIVPDGLVVNRTHKGFWRYLCQNSRIRIIASLPRGTFAPYTDAGTKIVYLTDKGVERTKWFYDVKLEDEPENSIGLDGFQFFYQAQEDPPSNLPNGIKVVTVTDSDKASSFSFKRPWKVDTGIVTVPLDQVAVIRNGTAITEADATPGKYQVIAGGRGTVPYTHDEFNADGNCFTISKSGAYAGYVWWHKNRIWSSDSLIVRSRTEEEYLSFYLFLCMKTKQNEIYDRQQGTGQPHIYSEHVKDFPIPHMSIEDQKLFTTEAYESLIAALEANEHANLHLDTAVHRLVEKYGGS